MAECTSVAYLGGFFGGILLTHAHSSMCRRPGTSSSATSLRAPPVSMGVTRKSLPVGAARAAVTAASSSGGSAAGGGGGGGGSSTSAPTKPSAPSGPLTIERLYAMLQDEIQARERLAEEVAKLKHELAIERQMRLDSSEIYG